MGSSGGTRRPILHQPIRIINIPDKGPPPPNPLGTAPSSSKKRTNRPRAKNFVKITDRRIQNSGGFNENVGALSEGVHAGVGDRVRGVGVGGKGGVGQLGD
eukprot:TRINITY_DN31154_c1_g1_i2.p5 TRINITY_DN31154_c1_g1~~TRINITY_DN31154_c1_g1_i2.p5  ORF type:complete len:101 (-),score=26.44 TRINITY_DN31154_c1_g1_i2:256-558(-)